MKSKNSEKIKKLVIAFIFMALGILIFKWYPMSVYGSDILFDASSHIVVASFILYFLYFFIDQNKSWRLPYLFFSFAVLIVISFQRIYDNAHNDIGLLKGLIIAIISIGIANWKEVKRKLKF